MRALAVFAILASALAAGAGQRLTADEVARRVRDRDTGRDSRAALHMKLLDRRGRARDRALTLLTLKGKDNAGDQAAVNPSHRVSPLQGNERGF